MTKITSNLPVTLPLAERLKLFDAATLRQQARQARRPAEKASRRGWARRDLYTRGGPADLI